jgi:hypothetical protein
MNIVRVLAIIAFAGLGAVSGRGVSRAGGSRYATIDYPTGASGANKGTFASGIDAQRDIVGSYVDSSGTSHGFLLDAAPTSREGRRG